MSKDDPLNGRQADTRTREFSRRMKPLESAEEFVGIDHVEAGAIITDKVERLAVLT
jgi:hypothetical protein